MADMGGGSRSPGFRNEIALLASAIVLFVIALATTMASQIAVSRGDAWLEQSRAWYVASSDLVALGESAALGATPAFTQIEERLSRGDAALASLSGTLSTAFPTELDAATASWAQARNQANMLVSARETWAASSEAVTALGAMAQEAMSRYEQVINRLSARQAPAAQLLLVAGQMTRLERIANLAQSLSMQSGNFEASAARLTGEVQALLRANEALLGSGEEIRTQRDAEADALLSSVGTMISAAQAPIDTIRNSAKDMASIAAATTSLPQSAREHLSRLSQLEASIVAKTGGGDLGGVLTFGCGAAAILLLTIYLWLSFRNAKLRQTLSDDRDNRQQGAILNLLDEITNLADGDLTVDVTVTEDFTGAIADSINYTVDTLRGLVGTINNTSVEIAAAASSTQDTAQKMNQASERQAREITNVTSVIAQTAESLTQVAARAEQIAQDAANSVEVAHNGAVTVGRTIQGMTAVREQIQETAKRIKRLGESSQEIGNIIEFINDIAEQTNTLALNASIQAAMAGEAGRGFAVVADEVQRLAERVGSATRQIETLVKTIQADTTEAIISMERSTATVVGGARSAEEAGQALTRIETTSSEVARLIQDIAAAARSQSAQATRIAGQMQAIREIAVQTSGSSGQTARAVGELTNLSEKLRESVAGFKLPADVSLMTSIDLSNAA